MNDRDIEEVNLIEHGNPLNIRGKKGIKSVSQSQAWEAGRMVRKQDDRQVERNFYTLESSCLRVRRYI